MMGCLSSGGGGTQTSTAFTPEQRNVLTQALDIYKPYLGQGYQPYGGERLAGFTPDQKAALGGMPGFLQQFSAESPIDMYQETGTALRGLLSGQTGAAPITPEQTRGFFESAYKKPAQYQFEEYTRPLIREEYAGPGFWGSPRAQAVTKAGQELGNWLGQKRGELEWQTAESNRALEEAKAGRALSASPLGMQYGQYGTQEMANRLAGRQGVFGFASAEQQQRQNEINVSMQKFQEGKQLTDPDIMNIIMNLLGMNYSTARGLSGRGRGPLSTMASAGATEFAGEVGKQVAEPFIEYFGQGK